jgi:DUF177 domain-containing protein
MTNAFVLNVHDLDASGKSFSAPLEADWLARALADCNMGPIPGGPDGSVAVRYSRSGDDVVVNGRVRARVVTPCVRCLEPVEIPVDAELALLFVPTASTKAATLHRHAAPGEEVEFTSDEADTEVYDGEKVVLDPYVREALLLEVPAFPLCSEACPGIAPPPPAEGAEARAETIDPRLAPLLALRSKRQAPSLVPHQRETHRGRSEAKNHALEEQNAARPARQGRRPQPQPLPQLQRVHGSAPGLRLVRVL